MGNGSLRIKKNAEKARERLEKEFQRGDTFKEMEEGKVFKKSEGGMGYDHHRYKEDGTTEKDVWYDGSWEYTGNTGETIRLVNPSEFSDPLLGHRANDILKREVDDWKLKNPSQIKRQVDKNPVNLTYDQLNKIKDQFTSEEYKKIMFRKGMGEGPQE